MIRRRNNFSLPFQKIILWQKNLKHQGHLIYNCFHGEWLRITQFVLCTSVSLSWSIIIPSELIVWSPISTAKGHYIFESFTDFIVCFLEPKYSSGAAIDWYYQYQTMYLRLMAENQLTKKTTTTEDPVSVCTGNYDTTEKIENGQPLTEVNSNQVTAGNRDYSCPRCGNAYTRPHSLNRHMRFECGVEPQFECPICHKKSKHKHNLVLHMRTHQKSWERLVPFNIARDESTSKVSSEQ